MKTAPLDEVCIITMGQAPVGDSYNDRCEGLPLIAGAGDFDGTSLAPTKHTTMPGKTCDRGDIVLSIRASIGAKVWADGRYCLGRGVAGIRPGPLVQANYIWHWLSHAERGLRAKGRGATFLQVNRRDIGELEVPLPPLEEQRRIAAILDQADAVRAKRRQVLTHLDSLPQVVFRRAFGDPLAYEGATARLGDLVLASRPITYGILKPGPDVDGGVPYVRVADMQDRVIRVETVRRTTFSIAAQYMRSRLTAGDLLMSIRGHVGRFAIVPLILEGANITQDSARLSFEDLNFAVFARAAMESPSVQRWFARRTKGAAVQGLNLGDLRLLPLPAPAPTSVRQFADTVHAVENLRVCVLGTLSEAENMFASLQARAFRGEL